MTPTTLEPTADSTPKVKKRRQPSSRRALAAAAAAANPNDTVTLTRAQLDELVARLTASAQSTATGLEPVVRSAPVTNGDFLAAVQAIIKETRPAEKITVGNRVAHNPMNPGNEERKWAKPFYQNFEEVETDDVTPLEYELIPLLKPGLFIKSRKGIPLVEVIIVKRGPQRGIHLRYDNSRKDKGMELMTYAPSLEVMLQRCIAEYKTQQEALAKRRAAGLPDEEED